MIWWGAWATPTAPQPEVHRVDPSTLIPVLEEMRKGCMEFVMLNMPGANNPGVAMAMQAADYVLIPTRPNDVDLRSGLETADVAKRLKKPMAFVFTFVEGTGADAQQMREKLENNGFAVAPKGLGDRRKEYAEAIANGTTVQEAKPDSASATESALFTNGYRKSWRRKPMAAKQLDRTDAMIKERAARGRSGADRGAGA